MLGVGTSEFGGLMEEIDHHNKIVYVDVHLGGGEIDITNVADHVTLTLRLVKSAALNNENW